MNFSRGRTPRVRELRAEVTSLRRLVVGQLAADKKKNATMRSRVCAKFATAIKTRRLFAFISSSFNRRLCDEQQKSNSLLLSTRAVAAVEHCFSALAVTAAAVGVGVNGSVRISRLFSQFGRAASSPLESASRRRHRRCRRRCRHRRRHRHRNDAKHSARVAAVVTFGTTRRKSARADRRARALMRLMRVSYRSLVALKKQRQRDGKIRARVLQICARRLTIFNQHRRLSDYTRARARFLAMFALTLGAIRLYIGHFKVRSHQSCFHRPHSGYKANQQT